jgi:hypothetical protein
MHATHLGQGTGQQAGRGSNRLPWLAGQHIRCEPMWYHQCWAASRCISAPLLVPSRAQLFFPLPPLPSPPPPLPYLLPKRRRPLHSRCKAATHAAQQQRWAGCPARRFVVYSGGQAASDALTWTVGIYASRAFTHHLDGLSRPPEHREPGMDILAGLACPLPSLLPLLSPLAFPPLSPSPLLSPPLTLAAGGKGNAPVTPPSQAVPPCTRKGGGHAPLPTKRAMGALLYCTHSARRLMGMPHQLRIGGLVGGRVLSAMAAVAWQACPCLSGTGHVCRWSGARKPAASVQSH